MNEQAGPSFTTTNAGTGFFSSSVFTALIWLKECVNKDDNTGKLVNRTHTVSAKRKADINQCQDTCCNLIGIANRFFFYKNDIQCVYLL